MKKGKIKKYWNRIKNEIASRRDPYQIALGIAVGCFLGVLPVQGIKTPVVFLIASVYKRLNIVATFLASTVFSLPFTFPFIYFLDYVIGCKLLNIPIIYKMRVFKEFDIEMLGDIIGAMIIGSLVLAISLAIFSYFLTLFLVNLKRNKLKNEETL